MNDYYVNPMPGIELENELKEIMQSMTALLEENMKNDCRLLVEIRKLLDYSMKKYNIDSKIFTIDPTSLRFRPLIPGYSICQLLNKFFGFSEDYSLRLCQVAYQFLKKEKGLYVYIESDFNYMTITKLVRLLPLENKDIKIIFREKKLTPQSTFKEIDQFVKNFRRFGYVTDARSPSEENEEENEKPKIAKKQLIDDGLVSITLPFDVLEHCRNYCTRKRVSIDDYIIDLIKKDMASK